MITNKHVSLPFVFLYDKQQPVERGFSVGSTRHWFRPNSANLPAATFTVWVISSLICNHLRCGLVQLLCKGCGYDNNINVHEMLWDIDTYVRTRFFWDKCSSERAPIKMLLIYINSYYNRDILDYNQYKYFRNQTLVFICLFILINNLKTRVNIII